MPGWVPFTGLTLVVLLVFLGLARLSQRAVEDQAALPTADDEEAAASDDGDQTDDSPDSSASGRTETTPVPADASHPAASPGDAAAVESGPVTITGESDATAAADGQAVEADNTDVDSERQDAGDRRASPELTTGALLANVALTQGLFGAIVATAAWYYEIPSRALGLSGGAVEGTALALLVGVGFGVALWTGNELTASLADAVGATYDETLREMLAPDGLGGWLLLLGVILPIIAGVEELVFRAALIGVPAAGFGVSPWVLAVLSSVAFALGHGAQGRVGIAVTGALGFVLAAGYVLSGSLLVVVVAHYLVNALEFLVHEGIGADRL